MTLTANTTTTVTVVATDNAGRTTTVTRYVKYVSEYYQQAATLAGVTPQSSLEATLTNSSVCAAIAANSEATTLMKNNYASSMRSYIVSNFNVGLNTLNKTCGLDYYLFYSGTDVSSVSGGWGYTGLTGGNTPTLATVNSTVLRAQAGANNGTTGSGVLIGNKSKISLNGYSTMIFTIGDYGSSYNHEVYRFCLSTNYSYTTLGTQGNLYSAVNWTSSNVSSYCEHVTGLSGTGDLSITVSSLTSSYYIVFMTQNSRLINVTKILLKN